MRARDALLEAVLPGPGGGLPAFAAQDRGAFWLRFTEVAPLGLRVVLGLLAWWVVLVMPWLLGYARPWSRLDGAAREAVIVRSERLPVVGPLLDVAKLVACFAYFDDEQVQRAVRGEAL